MSKVCVRGFSLSLDGFGAGPHQSLENPLGVRGHEVHPWLIGTRSFQRDHGDGSVPGTTGVDDDVASQSMENIGAWIMGRNMFGPVRGPWPNFDWRGWWGENPVYHVPVFVLTHHPRPDLVMDGGTTFHFVTDGIESALRQARAAAGGKDIRVGGGVSTVRQYLQARLIDELHLAVSPTLLGQGESLFQGLDLPALGYACENRVVSGRAAHLFVKRL